MGELIMSRHLPELQDENVDMSKAFLPNRNLQAYLRNMLRSVHSPACMHSPEIKAQLIAAYDSLLDNFEEQ